MGRTDMNVYTLSLGALSTNCYILEKDGKALVIDPADEGDTIAKYLKERTFTPVAVLLTHSHFDHMMGAEQLCRLYRLPLHCPEKDIPGLSDPIRNVSGLFGMPQITIVNTEITGIKEGDRFFLQEEPVEVLETPGHTIGSVCFKAPGILLSGDTLFLNGHGRTDLPGGSNRELQNSLHRILSLGERLTVYPGHGAPTTINEERRYFGLN